MNGYDFNKIHSSDPYFSLGLSSLIDSLLEYNTPWMGKSDCHVSDLPDIWVFFRDNASVLIPFVRQNICFRPVIIFGKDIHKRMLANVPGLEHIVFIKLNESPERAVEKIKKAFIACRYGVYVRPVNNQHYPELTPLESTVLTGLMSGMSVSDFAWRTGRSISSISSCKRRVMKKLNVFNNQELFVRAWAMGIHPDTL